jgi:hypothetical protein
MLTLEIKYFFGTFIIDIRAVGDAGFYCGFTVTGKNIIAGNLA